MKFCTLIFIRYRCLGNLGHVLSKSEYLNANAGLSYVYQLINVPDFNGVGESQPSPFFYQVIFFFIFIWFCMYCSLNLELNTVLFNKLRVFVMLRKCIYLFISI